MAAQKTHQVELSGAEFQRLMDGRQTHLVLPAMSMPSVADFVQIGLQGLAMAEPSMAYRVTCVDRLGPRVDDPEAQDQELSVFYVCSIKPGLGL